MSIVSAIVGILVLWFGIYLWRQSRRTSSRKPRGEGNSSRGFSLADLTGRLGSDAAASQHSTEKAAKAALVFEDRNDPTSSQRIIPEVIKAN
jgi:hypothetical protein